MRYPHHDVGRRIRRGHQEPDLPSVFWTVGGVRFESKTEPFLFIFSGELLTGTNVCLYMELDYTPIDSGAKSRGRRRQSAPWYTDDAGAGGANSTNYFTEKKLEVDQSMVVPRLQIHIDCEGNKDVERNLKYFAERILQIKSGYHYLGGFCWSSRNENGSEKKGR
jgi:hypothetical protein